MQCGLKDDSPSSSLSGTKDDVPLLGLQGTEDSSILTSLSGTKDLPSLTSLSGTKTDIEENDFSLNGQVEKCEEGNLLEEQEDDSHHLDVLSKNQIQNLKFIDSSELDLAACVQNAEKVENQIKDSEVITEDEINKNKVEKEGKPHDHETDVNIKIENVQETVQEGEQIESHIDDIKKDGDVKDTTCISDKIEEVVTNIESKEMEKELSQEVSNIEEHVEEVKEREIITADQTMEKAMSDMPKIGTDVLENEELSESAVIKIEGVEVKETDVDDFEIVENVEKPAISETVDAEDEKQYEIPSIEAFLPFTKFVNLKKLDLNKFAAFVDNRDREDTLVHYLKHKDTKKLKSLLRHSSWSINHPIRDSLWTHICRFLHKAEGNVYEEFERDLFANRPNVDVSLPSFVDYDNLTSYHLSEDGLKTVKKVMMILQHTNPDITYSPTLFEIVCIFLHYMSPSDTYNCVYGLLRAKDKKYIVQTKVAVEASKLVMKDLTKKFAKSAYVYLVRNSSNIEAVFETWTWWIFSDLPFPYLVKIFDCYLLEGVKVLYRVVLAILITFTKYSAKRRSGTTTHETSNGNLVSSIRQFCKDIPVTVEKLLKTGFGIRGFTRKEIRKLQVKNEMYINSRHLLNHDVPKSHSTHSALSRTFSGPMSLQHVESSIFSSDMPVKKVRSHSACMYLVIDIPLSILTHDELYNIWSWLPPRYAVCQPELLYTSEEHGTSLMTLYTRSENHEPTLIVIKTTTDEVFGAFCSTYWRDRRHKNKNLSYFGTGETFLFTLVPERKKYEWVGLHQSEIPNTANMFLAGDNSVLTIGGGHGEAIQLDANLLHCRTEKCDTFDNIPLCSSQDFTCKVVEVYGFH